MRGLWAYVALGLVGGWFAACASPMAFTCLSDDDCSGGSCVMGFCAFEDGDCESGLRFGDAAGDFANECVAVDGTGSTGGVANDSSEDSNSHSGSTLGLDDDGSSGDDTTSVGPVTTAASTSDPSTSGPIDPGTDSGGSSGSEGPTETGVGGTQSLELISNGDFSNNDAGWMTDNNPESVAGCEIPDDDSIVFDLENDYMLNDLSEGPSAHVLYQDFDVPPDLSDAVFSIAYAQDNPEPLDPQNVTDIIKDCLDGNDDGLQENALRIDIVDANADVFTATILFELATPDSPAGDPFEPTFDVITVDDGDLLGFLQTQAGNTLRLRIGKVESTFPWPVAVDDVSLLVEAGN